MTAAVPLPADRVLERRTFRACISGWSADAYDNQIVAITLPLIALTLAMTPRDAGAMVAATVAAMALGGWLGGAAVDRWGALRLFRGSILWFLLWSLPVALADDAMTLSIARTLQGFGLGAEWAAGVVLMANATPVERCARRLAGVQSGWAIGWGLAAVAGLVVASRGSPVATLEGWRVAILLGAVPALGALWLSRGLSDTPQVTRAAQLRPFAMLARPVRRATATAVALGFGAHGGYYGVFTWIPTYLKKERGLGELATTVHLLVIIVAFGIGCLTSGRIADRLGARATLAGFAAACIVAGLCYLASAGRPALMIPLGGVLGFCAAGVPALIAAALIGLYPPDARATGIGFCYNAGRLLGALFPLLTGWMAQTMALSHAIALAVASAYGLVAVAALMLPRHPGPRSDGNRHAAST